MAQSWLVLVSVIAIALRAASPARFPNILPGGGWWSGGAGGEGGAGADEVQVVYLPALLPREAQAQGDETPADVPLPYSFDAFGRKFDLQLVPNRRLLSPAFRVFTAAGPDGVLSAADASCHYIHTSPAAVAAFSACRDHALHGLIVTNNSAYEVQPLKSGRGRAVGDGRTAHIIRRAAPPAPPHDDARPLRPRGRHPRAWPNRPPPKAYTVEIALFLDEAAYNTFYPFMNYNEADLRDMLLAYINGVQALYHHASLGTPIQLSLVRLTLLRSQPAALPAQAERGRLLDSFCAYQRALNVEDDDDPQHWDMALLLSGLDLYSAEGGTVSTVTMGLAPVGGVCLPAHACVVAEFGATDRARPYPSAGFTSVYILAHEIGHNLGMHHDGAGNSCARDGYIMSPSRGTHGEASWSPCSARVVADLQWATCLLDGAEEAGEAGEAAPGGLAHERFRDAPGLLWGAKKQCEVLLRDRDAAPAQAGGAEGGACAQLACRSPHRPGHYYAGPALPGTPCAPGKWCQGGECVAQKLTTEQPRPASEEPPAAGSWSEWQASVCRSGCTLKGRGASERRRTCPDAACQGSSYDVVLCDDTKVCGKKKRSSANELAARRCSEYAAKLPELDPRGGGLQAPHDPTRMWMGCAVFCRRAGGGGFYAPRVELNGAGLDPYLPDGTWCHHDGRTHYYCMQHHCLPENFKISAQFHIWELPSEDIAGSFNARARSDDSDVAAAYRSYFSLDESGKPLARSVMAPHVPEDLETDWEVVDYVEIDRNDTMV